MTATITPVSKHDGATLTRAVAGERVMMDGGSAPVATLLQAFADRCEFAKDATAFSRPAWAESLYVASGGTNSSFTVGIGAISHVQTYRSGTTTHKTYAYAGGTIGASKIEGGGNLANSTWYYVYAYDNAGSLGFEISTTVRLDDESGAAGIAFCSDGGDKHYGFYPSGGKLRLTRFDGPDVYSWTILADVPHLGPPGLDEQERHRLFALSHQHLPDRGAQRPGVVALGRAGPAQPPVGECALTRPQGWPRQSC